MSMGTYASFADTVTNEFVTKTLANLLIIKDASLFTLQRQLLDADNQQELFNKEKHRFEAKQYIHAISKEVEGFL